MALSAAAPASAQTYRDRHHDGIGVGEIIAGAVVLGGIAAVVSSASRNNSRYGYDNYGHDYGRDYNRDGYSGYDRDGYRGNPRQAVQICINAAQREVGRYGYSRANVSQITDVRAKDWGYEVRGRIEVDGGRSYNRAYNNGWNNNGWNSYNRGSDSGSFKCKFERGQITGLSLSGIDRY